MVRIGQTLGEISKLGGRAEWLSQEKKSMDIMDMEKFLESRRDAEKRYQGSMAT